MINAHTGVTVSIIAVHGLGGHAKNTWTSSDTEYFWLGDTAKGQYLGKSIRVYTYGYDASVAFGRSIANLSQHADALLDGLNGQRVNGELEVRRPIIFICHSLGGIVVKKVGWCGYICAMIWLTVAQALLNAHNNRGAYGKIFESVYGIMFLGTPHQGTDAAVVGTRVAKMMSLGSFGKPSSLLKNLRTNSEALETISNDFQHHISGELRKVQKIVSFYEQNTTLGSVIVTRNSAVLHLAGDIESQVPLAVDHVGLCKFSKPDDKNLATISRHIQRLLEGAGTRHEAMAYNAETYPALSSEFFKLGKRLHKVHYEAHQEEVLSRRCDNTVRWILRHQTYIDWKEHRKSRVLWLNGEVGSGKTVTAASLINTLQAEFNTIIGPGHRPLLLYFFCDGKEAAKADPSLVLEALLHQVLVQRPSTGYEIDRQIQKTNRQFSLTITNGIKILQQALRNIPQAYLILDAIDECGGEKASLLSGLFGIVKQSNNINLLVTTRPHPGPDLSPVFQPLFNQSYPITQMSLAEEYVRNDIERFLSQKIAESPRIKELDGSLKEKIGSIILRQAGGIFLWASLAWEMFSNYSGVWTLKGVEERLEMLRELGHHTERPPPLSPNSVRGENSLYGLYTAILNRVPANRRDGSKRLFRFLVFAQTPLTLDELKVAYSLREGHSSCSSLEEDLPIGDFEDEVKSKCCPLVKVIGVNQTIKLVHQSIKEYFLDGNHEDYCFTSEHDKAHLHISISCLTFLSFRDFSNTPTSTTDEEAKDDFHRIKVNPFLKYSALNWSHHATQVGSHPKLWDKFLAFTRSGSCMNLAFRILWYFEGRGLFPQNTSPMHILCFLGLENLVRDAFQVKEGITGCSLSWARTDIVDCLGRTPLHWGAINGHAGVVSTLLLEGANPQARAPGDDGLGCTSLDLAVEYGHLNATKLLLKSKVGRTEHGRLLAMAAARGHTELVMIICSITQACDFGPALHAAVYGDHMETVRYLLGKHPSMDSKDPQHGTLLHVAAFEGNLNMVKLLLNNGADPNAEGGVHGSALQAAAYRNSQDIAIELLRRGADVNAKGGQHGSPLEAATFVGDMEMVELLKDHGAVSKGNRFVRRASIIDEASLIAIKMVEKEIVKGRLYGIEKRAIKFNQDLFNAVETGNHRAVEVMLHIGLRFFKFAVQSDRQSFMLFIVKTAMQLLQTAVKKEFREGIVTLTELYTGALTFALNERGSPLVGSLLQECIKDFNTMIEEGKDGDAENLVVSGIEILLSAVRGGNKDLIEVMMTNWVEAFEQLISGRFESNLVSIIDGYASRWVAAVETHDTKRVITWGTTAAEALSTATLGNQKRVASCLSSLFSQRIQEIFDHESNDLSTWLFKTSQSELPQLDMGKIDSEQVTRSWTFGVEFLLATESSGRRKRDCQASRARVLELCIPFFKAVESSGFLNLLAETTRMVVDEKFGDCSDKKHVLLLVEDISRVIDAILNTYRSAELVDLMTGVKENLRHAADQTIVSKWE